MTKQLTMRNLFAVVLGFFIMCFVFNDVYKELRKNCYDLQQAHRRMWELIISGLFMWACIFLIAYSRGWF
jgi:hypothetical protein